MTIHPLTPFTHWGRNAPYETAPPRFGEHATVLPYEPSVTLVTTSRCGVAHVIDAMAVITGRSGRPQYGSRFICSSAGTQQRPIEVQDPEPYGGVCRFCLDIQKGPCVYRCYDAEGALLYIGSTAAYLRRMAAHRTEKPWWHHVARTEAERFPEISLARARETAAILAERPRWNIRQAA